MTETRARCEITHDGRIARIQLAAPKANIVDRPMISDLGDCILEIRKQTRLRAILLGAEGPHFSFGASVEEHVPGEIEKTLAALHGLLGQFLDLPAPTIAVIRGQCLGGGLELALVCDLILSEETAQLGLPEIKLGVFPPAASALLPARIGSGPAAALTLTGASWSGSEAAARGLVTETAPDGEIESMVATWLEEHFIHRSPGGNRYAAQAIRRRIRHALTTDLPELERLYIEDLMGDPDAVEGINAFLEKRPPDWHQVKGTRS